jgi:3-deoxy-manno-octulosonate cytidylyltransferase (CMP-KDO synthetase)
VPANPIVVIPARMASTRLPDKPLADIAGTPMIVHVWRRAMEAEVGPVVVACAEAVIVEAVERAGGKAVLTRPDHPSGSDRVHEAVERLDPNGAHDVVLNVQGDLPTLDPALVRVVLGAMAEPSVDIATLAVAIRDAEERAAPSVVKAVVSAGPGAKGGRALYFSRQPVPWGEGALYHHIGLYGFRRNALRRFVALPPSPLEQREKLEQLRALENGMRIEVAFVDTVPLGVDTPADLARARSMLASGSPSH